MNSLSYLPRAVFIFAPEGEKRRPEICLRFAGYSPPTIDFQNSPSSDFYTARDLSLAWPPRRLREVKRLAPLAKKLVKLDSAVVSMGFSGALSSFSHFLDCSRSPCRSLLKFRSPLFAKRFCRLLSSWSRGRKRTSSFFFFGGIHLQNPGKNSEHYACRPLFLSNCVIIGLVQQRYAYQV